MPKLTVKDPRCSPNFNVVRLDNGALYAEEALRLHGRIKQDTSTYHIKRANARTNLI